MSITIASAPQRRTTSSSSALSILFAALLPRPARLSDPSQQKPREAESHSVQRSTLEDLTTSVTRFGHVWAMVRDQILAITTARELLKLNERALKDIGVDRAELERVSLLRSEPFESHPTRLPIR